MGYSGREASGAASHAQGRELADMDANDDAGADTPNADFGAISEASITTGALAGVTTVEVGSQSTSTWSHGG